MSKKRLYRSSDAVISGVCGGMAEYFGIDPTLVRIIAIALTIVGFGFPALLYVILMIALPPDPGIAQGYVDARCEATGPQSQRVSSNVAAGPVDTAASTAAASSTSSVASEQPETQSYASEQPETQSYQPPPPDPTTRVSSPNSAESGNVSRADNMNRSTKNHSHTILITGAVLIGIGILALLCNFVHISLWRFWPVVIIVVGVVYLFTPGSLGWSLERAGNAIVLITVGLALLAWMLQIINVQVFVAAFLDLWPMLLVVIGLSIIGSARKNSVIMLTSSLVLSATVLLGLWIYGGLNWETLSAAFFLGDSDGIHEFLSDLPFADLPFIN